MGKVILISGASTGIGAKIATTLARGNKLFINYRSSVKKAEEVAEEIRKKGGEAFSVQQDISSEQGCIDLIEEVKSKTDRLDVIVNNAGALFNEKTVSDISWDLMDKTFSLNTFAAMMLTSLAIPLLEKGTDANIVNITSVVIRTGGPGELIYAASKAALDSFTRGLARELAPGIRANAVAPGVVVTPFHEKVSTSEQMEVWRQSNPLKINGEPKHIAETVKLLVENNYINGETIDVNGGVFSR